MCKRTKHTGSMELDAQRDQSLSEQERSKMRKKREPETPPGCVVRLLLFLHTERTLR